MCYGLVGRSCLRGSRPTAGPGSARIPREADLSTRPKVGVDVASFGARWGGTENCLRVVINDGEAHIC